MACLNPVIVIRDKNNPNSKWGYISRQEFEAKGNRINPNVEVAFVPCGSCPECKKQWRNQLAQRVLCEFNKYGSKNCFLLNLTVDDEHMQEVFPNGSLDHKYFQKFMKRLRINLERNHSFTGKIKYFLCGEYGGQNMRPHFHLIVFGWKPHDLYMWSKSQKGYKQYRSDFIAENWKAGFITVGEVSEHTAPYMAKYICKYAEIRKDDFEINGKIVRKPYLVYPREMLGWDYFIENMDSILRNGNLLMSNGKTCGIPTSWKKKVKALIELGQASDELISLWNVYQEQVQLHFEEERRKLEEKGYVTLMEQYEFIMEDGKRRREKLENYKLINTGKELAY